MFQSYDMSLRVDKVMVRSSKASKMHPPGDEPLGSGQLSNKNSLCKKTGASSSFFGTGGAGFTPGLLAIRADLGTGYFTVDIMGSGLMLLDAEMTCVEPVTELLAEGAVENVIIGHSQLSSFELSSADVFTWECDVFATVR